MGKQAEIDYLKNMFADSGQASVDHAVNMPFSDPECANYLADLAGILQLLPPPPARLLDMGCGTGWTSCFFARRGYAVVGVDIAPDMIALAKAGASRHGLANVEFFVKDYEDLDFEAEFDGVVFFASLHHAVDEKSAIKKAFQSLRVGGRMVTDEPGKGHAHAEGSLEAKQKYGVTERDMPPSLIFAAGRIAGFSEFFTYPRPSDFTQLIYRYRGTGLRATLEKLRNMTKLLRHQRKLMVRGGLALMVK